MITGLIVGVLATENAMNLLNSPAFCQHGAILAFAGPLDTTLGRR